MYIDAHVVYIHTYVHTPAHTRALSFSLSLAISLSLSPSLSLTLSLSLAISLSLSPLRARALSLFLSPSFSFPALFSFFFCRYTFPLARKYMVCKSNGSSVQVCVCCRLSLFVGCCWLLFIVCWCLLLLLSLLPVLLMVRVCVLASWSVRPSLTRSPTRLHALSPCPGDAQGKWESGGPQQARCSH